jgi:hypothetical protein
MSFFRHPSLISTHLHPFRHPFSSRNPFNTPVPRSWARTTCFHCLVMHSNSLLASFWRSAVQTPLHSFNTPSVPGTRLTPQYLVLDHTHLVFTVSSHTATPSWPTFSVRLFRHPFSSRNTFNTPVPRFWPRTSHFYVPSSSLNPETCVRAIIHMFLFFLLLLHHLFFYPPHLLVAATLSLEMHVWVVEHISNTYTCVKT